MMEYLKTIPENDLVCFVDGCNVICVRDLNELADDFFKIQKETGCKMVVGYDFTRLFPAKIASLLYMGTCNNIPLNSGTYIGIAKDVFEIVKRIYNLNQRRIKMGHFISSGSDTSYDLK